MGIKDKILRHAQDWANRTQTNVIIYQSANGQWLRASFNEKGLSENKAEVVKPQAVQPKELTSSEYMALSHLYNNCNEAYKTLSDEWKQAYIHRLYSK